ncbi:hypothetical protein [Escherichia phage Ecp_YSF]|nr:hypothetical protein [Escherichia phage Ecp_YSF]
MLRFINHISKPQCAKFGYVGLEDHGEDLNLIKPQLAFQNHLHLF